MKIFVDTNLFIDILLDREPFSAASAKVYRLCENDMIDGYIAPITINNIYYICRKAKRIETVKELLFEISTVFTIASMNSASVRKANSLSMNNYEDALQYTMAMQNGCEYLVTRNTKDYKELPGIRVLEPEVLLSLF